MFHQKLIRNEDALIIFDALACLIRQSGQPLRPRVPSPLKKYQDHQPKAFGEGNAQSVEAWGQETFANLVHDMKIEPDHFRLIDANKATTNDQSTVTYDPDKVEQVGRFLCSLTLQIVEPSIRRFNPSRPLTPVQRALSRLTACAYYRQGFTLSRHIPDLTKELGPTTLPHRLVENTLIFSACLGLIVRRQTPEQIIATYGSLMNPSVRRKIRPACRQIEDLKSEVRFLQLIAGNTQTRKLSNDSVYGGAAAALCA